MTETNRSVAYLSLLCLLTISPGWCQAQDRPSVARGVVFEDRNGNGRRESGEPGLAKVPVSNGEQVVQTDDQGRWTLPVGSDTCLFVIKPSGWMTPLDQNHLPRFYYLHKPGGSPPSQYPGLPPTGPLPASIDFPLVEQDEPDHFKMIVFADTQTHNIQAVDWMARDVVADLVGVQAAFGVTLGDIVDGQLDLFEPIHGAIGRLGLTWYNVIGNHDLNEDSADDAHSDETFQRTFGPPYYAFNHGLVHFIVLDNIHWDGKKEGRRYSYHGLIGPKQLEFIRNNLALVPPDRLVVLLMHIPFHAGPQPHVQVADRRALFKLLADRPHTFSLAGHMHYHAHTFFDTSDGWPGQGVHHQVINGTVSGSWWRGAPDELGIPHTTMRDGTPNGYSIVSFDGTSVRLQYRAARRPSHYQMNIYAPDEIAAADTGKTLVLVNVFAGSSRSNVELRVGPNTPWRAMEQFSGLDPAFVALKEIEQSTVPPPKRPLPDALPTDHLWRALLPSGLEAGTHLIQVREVDVFDQTHTASRVIRVKQAKPDNGKFDG